MIKRPLKNKVTGATAEEVVTGKRRVGNGLAEDGEGRCEEFLRCRHHDVAGNGYSNNEESPRSQENQAKASCLKDPTGFYSFCVKISSVFLDSDSGCFPRSLKKSAVAICKR
jgi:hypothetical protein